MPELPADGYEVRALDNLSAGKRDYLANHDVEFVEASVGDSEAVESALRGIDSVVHLTAAGSVVDSVLDPVPNFHTNVVGTVNGLFVIERG